MPKSGFHSWSSVAELVKAFSLLSLAYYHTQTANVLRVSSPHSLTSPQFALKHGIAHGLLCPPRPYISLPLSPSSCSLPYRHLLPSRAALTIASGRS